MILDQILQHKRKEVEEMKLRFPLARLEEGLARLNEPRRSLLHALNTSTDLHVIAELKQCSPSHGIIRHKFHPLTLAQALEYAGASALSILTEPHYFHGRPSYLKTIRRITTLPLLRKDFIIDRYQIYESALLSADAVLLIASILTYEELKSFIDDLRQFAIDALVEVHTDDDLKKALDAEATVLGINNRNLKTLEVNVETAERLLKHIPKGKKVVVESGFDTHDELMKYKSVGVDAFLIGTSIMKSPDVIGKLRELKGEH